MPYKDPDKRREKDRERSRARRAANPEKSRESVKKWRAEHPEQVSEYMREYGRQWYQENKEKRRESSRKWRAANPDKVREQKKRWKESGGVRYSAIKSNYGISKEEYDHIFEAQGGRCAICGIHQDDHFRLLSVDHDHKTGKVRGLLCGQCNAGMGNLRDDIHILQSAIQYLQSH